MKKTITVLAVLFSACGEVATEPEPPPTFTATISGQTYTEVDQPVDLASIPWGLDRIDQRVGLDGSYTPGSGKGVTVYVVDTGIDYRHPEFKDTRFRRAYDLQKGRRPGEDCHGHGTHVSGTIAGSTVGVATDLTLVSVRVFPDCRGTTSVSEVIKALDWVASNLQLPAVVNLSLIGGFSPAFNAAVQQLVDLGAVVPVAAGNFNDDACNYSPASVPAALTIGASEASDGRAGFSNWGDCIDFFAPGQGIKSSLPGGGYGWWSGTSMSAPHTAGVISIYLSTNPTASPFEVENQIRSDLTRNVITESLSENAHLLYSNNGEDS